MIKADMVAREIRRMWMGSKGLRWDVLDTEEILGEVWSWSVIVVGVGWIWMKGGRVGDGERYWKMETFER